MDHAEQTVEMSVTLVVGSDPIRGTTAVQGRERHEFWGWLELAEVFQQAAEGGLPPREGPPAA